uniref:SPRY domain-containing protein n=1 Tax=Globodera rostochiensis TaxID=31243 RepID=A0A914HHP3_GLORO
MVANLNKLLSQKISTALLHICVFSNSTETAVLNCVGTPFMRAVAHVGIDSVGPQCAAVTNRGNLFQTPAYPQPLHNIPASTKRRNAKLTIRPKLASKWMGTAHTQLTIVEPGTVINGSYPRATPHTAIAKFALSPEKPYFERAQRRSLRESAPLNRRFDYGLNSNISPIMATDVIGCGVLFNTERAVVITYTINGEHSGERPMKGDDVMSELFSFVTLEGPLDRIEANFEENFTYEFN